MTDAYFDELGIAWRANVPDMDALTTRLRTRLRRQAFRLRAEKFLETIMMILAMAVGVFIVWLGIWHHRGWRVTTAGVLVIAIIATMAVFERWTTHRERGDTKNLSNMIDLAISRQKRVFGQVRLGYLGCALVALLVAAVWILDSPAPDLPADIGHHRRLIASAAAISWVIVGPIVGFYQHRRAQRELDKFEHLKRLLEAE